jgi:hypothetical protein
MHQFAMSLSVGVRWVTTLVVLLLVALPVLVWGGVPGIRVGPGGELALWATLVSPAIALLSWAIAPKGLEIEGGELRVLRRSWPAAVFPLAGVEQVAVLPPGALRLAIRTFGVGGLFGYYGWFYRKGPFRLYATRRDTLVEIVVRGGRIVVSPDDPARFVDALLRAAPRASRGQPGEPGTPSASTRS